ncbi:endolysin; inhibits RNA polymerase [Dinoroseobacter phage vB_DshS-R5C]|uniref:dATP/dGTP diphosphohydrolase N-terminal domain-containing protein n=1 Tax=Dinoroseobacter phage vB_DshS-R5C TaxID=1965368 RepID=A0A1V0DY19_9CAUD|nr:endolysin; inhibits RNA polymerase [Dinoroseobacter phage vB_DshS-R5C]ARB06064.1 hypothetical protein vBDshSR5C_10 [Dinoroseobacter phage vB_DshS-R5C]
MEKDTNPKDAIGTKKWRQFMAVPRQVLWEVGVGMLEGALKYGRHNYRAAGVRASVYLDAAFGHLDQFVEGEDVDADSGLSHVTKAICSLVVLRDAMMNDFWVDDRPPKIKDLDGVRARLQAMVEENFERYEDKNPHHYTQAEDEPPYLDPDGQAFFGVNLDRYKRAAMDRIVDSGEWQSRVDEEKARADLDMKKRADALSQERANLDKILESLKTPTVLGMPPTFDDLTDLGYWNASDEDFENDDILATAAAQPALVYPSEMRIGKYYRAARRHNGDDIPEHKGGVWKCLRKEGDDVFGVKPGWRRSHLGTKLAPSTQFVEIGEPVATERRIQRDLLAHAQSSASVTPPTCGLSSHAINLLCEWREAETGSRIDIDGDPVAEAMALKQWAKNVGILDK